MRPLLPAFVSVVVALSTARLAAQADSTPPNPDVSPAPPTVSAPVAPAPDSTPPPADASAPGTPRTRAMSPEIAARLSEKMPKFTPSSPPVSAPASPIVQAPPPEIRDADKPRNTIIRLDPYQVIEAKPPAFKERELLTPKGRLDVALKRYPGLKFGGFWIFSNNGVALAMYEEDLAIERRKEMKELYSLASLPSEREKVRNELNDLQVNSRH